MFAIQTSLDLCAFRFALLVSLIGLASTGFSQDDKVEETIFSGPQLGEALPTFQMKSGFGDRVGKEMDLVTAAGDNPIVIIFVHKRSRPAFGLANTVMRYCTREGGDKLTRGICFLTGDATDTQNWLGKIKNYFPKGTPVGYSAEGIEGPGSYGLNRNVELTVLVGKANKVTANFALVQPGAHVDGPKILAAIAEATGGKKNPDINKYLNNNQSVQDAPIAIDPGLMKQIRLVNAKEAPDESVGEAIDEIKTMITDNPPLQRQLGTIVVRWVRSKRVDTIGNDTHQKQIRAWAKAFGPKMNRRMKQDRPAQRRNDKLTGLLRSVIQKSNTDEEVDAAAKAVEEYVDDHPAAAAELARITNTVVNSDKIGNYGTPHCQEVLKAWAKKYKRDEN